MYAKQPVERRLSSTLAAIVIGLSCGALTQLAVPERACADVPVCCDTGLKGTARTDMQIWWDFHPNQRRVTSVPVVATSTAVSFNLEFWICYSQQEPPVCCQSWDFDFYSDVGLDAIDVWPNFAAFAEASAGYLAPNLPRSRAIASALADFGRVSAFHQVDVQDVTWLVSIEQSPWWEAEADSVRLDVGSAGAVLDQKWILGELHGSEDFSIDLYLDLEHEVRMVTDPCEGSEQEPESGSILGVTFFKVKIHATYSNSTSNTEIISGLLGNTAEANAIRLGILASEAFGEMPTAQGSQIIAIGVPLPVTLSLESVDDVRVVAVVDQFSRFDGDLSPSAEAEDVADWNDRRAFIALLGSAIGDDNYNPRADLDLNGDIDLDDYSLYVAVFNNCACAADYDADGEVTTPDIFTFLGDHFAMAFVADFDGNGTVESSDIFAFLAAWFDGCD